MISMLYRMQLQYTKNMGGYGCRVHHFVKCLIVAYATRKTMIICNDFDWQFTSGGWENLFLPLSDNCTLNDGETVSLWPGRYNVDYALSVTSTFKTYWSTIISSYIYSYKIISYIIQIPPINKNPRCVPVF